MDDSCGFNKRVKAWIDKKHKGNVLAASRDTGIGNSTLHMIYRGYTRAPGNTVYVKLARAMGCSIDFLITGRDRPLMAGTKGGKNGKKQTGK